MPLLARFVRFGLTGVGVTALHVLVATSLIEISVLGPPAANGLAFVIAACASFMINAHFTFRARFAFAPFIRFLMVTGFCGALSAGIAAFAEAQGLDYKIGIAAVVAIIPMLSFLLHNFWSFRRP